ncbi:hypothetical protein A33O_08026 [Nitratireductor aquibiodomus RA22]|uniref:Uncharacterized protein n=1 Tax=Nitratireductor aquibiodomus RA22 TaxID=1189611 RepID=I5C0Y2_9HYPH|nr:hypothetical protein A33O_08026 [Nitratireductor aquibiodomus RA22]
MAVLAVVLLPEPLGPISVTISPRRTERSTPRTSQRPPRLIPALCISTSVSLEVCANDFDFSSM